MLVLLTKEELAAMPVMILPETVKRIMAEGAHNVLRLGPTRSAPRICRSIRTLRFDLRARTWILRISIMPPVQDERVTSGCRNNTDAAVSHKPNALRLLAQTERASLVGDVVMVQPGR